MFGDTGFLLSDWSWPLGFLTYAVIGFLIARPNGGPVQWFMGILGWPLELTQKLGGSKNLPYLFLFPNLLIFGLFTFSPLFMNMGFSVSDGQSIIFSGRDFSGADNLKRLLLETQIDTGQENWEDDKFKSAVVDTLIFVVFQVPLMILLALITALVLNRKIVGRPFWRSIFFYPVMLSPVVVGFLWTLVLKRQGVLSEVLMRTGWIDAPIQWLTEPFWTMFWSIFVYSWAHLGFYMLILLAGLQAIPNDLYEAAEMDGTPTSRIFFKITLPLLMPTLLVVSVLSLIKAFQAFEELYAMEVHWVSLVAYIFETAGVAGQKTAFGLGIAATASLIVATFLIGLSLIQMVFTRKQVKL